MSGRVSWLEKPVKGLLLDISGVLRDGEQAIAGSVEAFRRYQLIVKVLIYLKKY